MNGEIKAKTLEITGLGAVTPLGGNADEYWRSLIAGKVAFGPIRIFSTRGQRTHVAAEIQEPPEIKLRRLDKKCLSRADAFALAASLEALEQAHLLDQSKGSVLSPKRIGIIVGTAAGAILELENFFRNRALGKVPDLPCPRLSSFCLSSIATNIAKEFIIEGPRMTIATVCSSSGLALAAARELLLGNELDYVLVTGTETLSEVILAGFNSLRSVAPDLCRPFDMNRKGIILGEGAGAMVIETLSSVKRRNIRSLGCLSGYGLTTDIHHFTAPEPDGRAIAETIRHALDDSNLKAGSIDYINAHGTGTQLNDRAETRGLKTGLGAHASKVSVSSIKSMIGHQLGASSILEAIATVLSIKNGLVPPTKNLLTPDPECDLDYIPGNARKQNIRCALSNSFAFGGSNISLAFCKNRDSGHAANSSVYNDLKRPVITGIGVVTPVGIGKNALIKAICEGKSGLAPLSEIGDAWATFRGGLVDILNVRKMIPVSIRRRLNRQAYFLYAAFKEAIEDSGITMLNNNKFAMTYGSAFGCSGNVHRFYSQILSDGPRFSSPQEFSMSVTNAPPALVAQEFGLTGPIWVFVSDEASWEVSLDWAAKLIRRGKADHVLVSATEEISESVMAILHNLGLLKSEEHEGIIPGEGAVSMMLESADKAVERGSHIYGKLQAVNTVQDSSCGPQDYSKSKDPIIKATADCINNACDGKGDLICITGVNTDDEKADILKSIKNIRPCNLESLSLRNSFGDSGISGGLGLASALLCQDSSPTSSHVLVLTSARGGINAASLIELANGNVVRATHG